MIRSIGLALALATGSVTAGELVDCFNDETDADARHTSSEPEVLRVTDADISVLLERIRHHENKAVVSNKSGATLLVRHDGEKHASD